MARPLRYIATLSLELWILISFQVYWMHVSLFLFVWRTPFL